MPQSIIELLNNAAQANEADSCRKANLIRLPAAGSLLVSGDTHGHRRNFERIVALSDLPNNPDRHVVFQEIIHGGPEDSCGGCLSYKLLLDVAKYKLDFPDQVHILLGNHAAAFITNSDVMKGGKEMNRAMRSAIEREFSEDAADITAAIRRFLLTFALAVRCENRIWISHSLPADRFADKFDPEILNRALIDRDFMRSGSVYLLTWGRRHSRDLLEKMAGIFDVDLFILGHQPQEEGCCQAGDNLLILASDHNHGCVAMINLAESYSMDQLVDTIIPITSVT